MGQPSSWAEYSLRLIGSQTKFFSGWHLGVLMGRGQSGELDDLTQTVQIGLDFLIVWVRPD